MNQLTPGHHSVLAQFARQYAQGDAPARVVEVGVLEGRTARYVLDESNCHLWAVDPWISYDESDAQHSGNPYGIVPQSVQDQRFVIAQATLKPYTHNGRCKLLRMTSLAAAATLKGEGQKFDIVFIDADHRRDAVFADCVAWWELVRKGGLLCGHDLGSWVGVDQGVANFMDHCAPGLELNVFAFHVWAITKP